MGVETSFTHPPKGHFAVLQYDSVNDKWYAVLCDADGHQQIDVLSSALPSGAATAANQATILTRLELIDDLRNALDSVGEDELDVNIEDSITLTVQATGGDKLFSFESAVHDRVSNTNAAAGLNDLDSTAVPTGKVWVVTSLSCFNVNNNPTTIRVSILSGGTEYWFKRVAGPGANITVDLQGWFVLEAGDKIRASFDGCVAGDDLWLVTVGYQMHAP